LFVCFFVHTIHEFGSTCSSSSACMRSKAFLSQT
jgi:hypothetical protein